MDFGKTCDEFLLETTSSSNTNSDYNCNKFLREGHCEAAPSPLRHAAAACDVATGSISSSSSKSSGLMAHERCAAKEAPSFKLPNIPYELAVAKTILQQYSSISGENLFDHLSDIIRRVIDERPPNVIDFFEEFSRNVREQKFHLPERFPPEAVVEETRLLKMAKKQFISMKLPHATDVTFPAEEELEEEHNKDEDFVLDFTKNVSNRFHIFNDRVQYLQFFWNQCGLSISSEDIFQLACSMNRLQAHPSIRQCRFWGMINGLKASYYIVEAILSSSEYEARLQQMEKEIQENSLKGRMENSKHEKLASHIGPELTPGAVGWEHHPTDDILRMKSPVLPVPLVKNIEEYDIPPEPIGRGINRYSYFVVNSLSDEWTELPISTPKQITLSRSIKKFLKGDLEDDIISYPAFCGKEKHYLRAMIARITAGTCIAPRGYYRPMTKREVQLFEGQDYNDEEDADDEGEEDEETQSGLEEEYRESSRDNDIVLLRNENYNSSVPLKTLNNPEKWVHIRPNILLQGRVVWYNQHKAEQERERARKRLENNRLQEHIGDEESVTTEDNEEASDDEFEEEELELGVEEGPAILSPCSRDVNADTPRPWVGRFTSLFTNESERILLMQSTVWPGASTFVYKDLCESIYLGWGHKTVARNMRWTHLPPVEEEYKYKGIESIDPSVEEEEAYQLSLLRKDSQAIDSYNEHDALESSDDTGDDDDDEDDDDKEQEDI